MDAVSQAGFKLPTIRRIDGEQPWLWLAAGWRDLCRHPAISLSYGAAFTLASYALTAALVYFDLLVLLLPLAAGVVFVGPMLAVGLYEMSRRIETGAPIRAHDVVFVATRSPTQIAFIGLILVFFMLAWVRLATLLFALFFGPVTPPLDQLLNTLLFSLQGLSFLAVGGAVGGVLALLAFAISAISIPRLMAQDTDAITAIATSVAAVSRNFWPMLLWGWLIAMLTAIGVVTFYFGLILTFPLIGHATWHAYRSLVDEPV
jgi:uncharacterized membrane protein